MAGGAQILTNRRKHPPQSHGDPIAAFGCNRNRETTNDTYHTNGRRNSSFVRFVEFVVEQSLPGKRDVAPLQHRDDPEFASEAWL
jgi:hypothetical protein